MRALCASIITAGALIGLGLTGIGLGLRYQSYHGVGGYAHFKDLDTPMMLVLVVLLAMTLIGIATVYVGLAYHHERRHHERHHLGSGKGESFTSRLGE